MRAKWAACGMAMVLVACADGRAGDAPPVGEANAEHVQERMAVFEQSLQADPGNVELMLVLARGYGEAGRLKDAQVYAQRAAAASPTNASVHQVLGNLAYLQADHAAAIRHFRMADPDGRHAAVQLNLSLALLEVNQMSEARAAFQRATELDPTVTAPYADVARRLRETE